MSRSIDPLLSALPHTCNFLTGTPQVSRRTGCQGNLGVAGEPTYRTGCEMLSTCTYPAHQGKVSDKDGANPALQLLRGVIRVPQA